MPALKKISLLKLTTVISAFVLHQSYRVTPGVNVGPFYVWKTTISELKKQLGDGKISTNEWRDKYNNEIHKNKTLSYPGKGLSFIFLSEAKSQKDFFGVIEVKRPCDAQTDQGISVYSTRADVNKIYSKFYSMGDTINNLVFREAGITFNFGNCSIARLTDTIISIRIYQPAVEYINYIPK